MGNVFAAEKVRGFQQGLYQISSTAKEVVGTLRRTKDGRAFRYAKAGTSALSAGKMGICSAPAAAHVNETPDASAIGDSQIVVTVTAGTAIAENELRGGYMQVNDATGEGHQYLIESNAAITAAQTDVYLNLVDPIRVALTTSSEVTLIKNPWYGVTESTTEESLPAGVAPVAVTANYYYWCQTGGIACVLCSGTPAVGSMMTLAATAGAVAAINATLDVDQPILGIHCSTVGVSGEYKPIRLLLD